MALRFASLKSRGSVFLRALAAALFLAGGVKADAVSPLPGLPLTFDSREHLPRPDLSAYARLRFLTTLDFPPFNFADDGDRLAGFNVDLVREICAILALQDRCQIQTLPFSELEAALAAGQAEAVIAGVAISSATRDRFEFSRPYLVLPARFAIAKRAWNSVDPVPAPGWKVGVVAQTAHEAMAKAWFPAMAVQGFETQEALLDGLKEGRVDAAFSDALRLAFWVSGNAAAGCCVLAPGAYSSEHFLGEGLAIMVRKKDRILADAFDHAMAELAANGRLEEIYLRYFPQGLF